MTPEEKAIELVNKFKDSIRWPYPNDDINCAIKHVDEITELLCNLELLEDLKFYEKVKEHLNNIN